MKKGALCAPFFSHAALLIERQWHLAQVTSGFNQNQWAFVEHGWGRAFTRGMHGFGFGGNGSLYGGDLASIRVDPL